MPTILQTMRHLRRYDQIGRILTRYGFGHVLTQLGIGRAITPGLEKLRFSSSEILHATPAERMGGAHDGRTGHPRTRIQDFLDLYLDEVCEQAPSLPKMTFVLDRHGVARELSLPLGEDQFHSDIVSSYRVKQGILNNPA